jgi:hypothetical protein
LKESLGFHFVGGKRRSNFECLLHGSFHAEFGGTDGMIDALIEEGRCFIIFKLVFLLGVLEIEKPLFLLLGS